MFTSPTIVSLQFLDAVIFNSCVTTDPADPAMQGGAARRGAHAQHAEFFLLTSNAYLFPLLFFSLATSDASDKICSRPRLTKRMW